jgi:tRNA-dihydrouridine synthase
MSFWHEIEKPVIGLSPMDGVTDLPYRMMHAKYGNPDVIFTEFIPVEGIVRLNERLLMDFWYCAQERPVVAQIYGKDLDLFYSSTQLVCELGFDGVDINMGCPARSVVHRGCGAALINTPKLAQDIVHTVKQAVLDWEKDGINWEKWPVIPGEKARKLLNEFAQKSQQMGLYEDAAPLSDTNTRVSIPVTVKTRIGFDKPVVEEWMDYLLQTPAEVISIHGRTLKQMYTGGADWEEIKRAVDFRNTANSDKLIFGNGDVKTVADAAERVKETEVDGILIGRGTFGNPWLFKDFKQKVISQLQNGNNTSPKATGPRDLHDLFSVMLEHAKLHDHYKPEKAFVQMRKNLAWYISGIPGASNLRAQLVRSSSPNDIESIIENYKADHDS